MSPRLIVTVDVEEIFDWNEFDRVSIEVPRTAEINRFQAICEKFKIKPVYFITYPMLGEGNLTKDLMRIHKQGKCDLGIHVHTWTTPPYLNHYDAFSSYQGNLSSELERAKIKATLDEFERVFGFKAILHRAGRFGCGQKTFSILQELGVQYDYSPSAGFDFTKNSGPNFSSLDSEPFYDATYETICFPVTGSNFLPGPDLLNHYLSISGASKIIERFVKPQMVRLTTEGNTSERLRIMTKMNLRESIETFVFTIHTTSFFKEGNQYSNTSEAVEFVFTETEKYFSYFFNEAGGRGALPKEYAPDKGLRRLDSPLLG